MANRPSVSTSKARSPFLQAVVSRFIGRFDGAVGINQIAKGKFACLRGMFDPQIGYFFLQLASMVRSFVRFRALSCVPLCIPRGIRDW